MEGVKSSRKAELSQLFLDLRHYVTEPIIDGLMAGIAKAVVLNARKFELTEKEIIDLEDKLRLYVGRQICTREGEIYKSQKQAKEYIQDTKGT